jgi:hypothetical protein
MSIRKEQARKDAALRFIHRRLERALHLLGSAYTRSRDSGLGPLTQQLDLIGVRLFDIARKLPQQRVRRVV